MPLFHFKWFTALYKSVFNFNFTQETKNKHFFSDHQMLSIELLLSLSLAVLILYLKYLLVLLFNII